MQLVASRRRAARQGCTGQVGLSGYVYTQLVNGNLLIFRWWSCVYMQPSVLFAAGHLGDSVLSQKLVFGLPVLLPDCPDGGRQGLFQLGLPLMQRCTISERSS